MNIHILTHFHIHLLHYSVVTGVSNACIVLQFLYSGGTLLDLKTDMDLLVQLIELEREAEKQIMKVLNPVPSKKHKVRPGSRSPVDGLLKPSVVKGKHLLCNSLT